MRQFKAPWGTVLWVMSALATSICIAIAALPNSPWARTLPLLGMAVAALFIVRDYRITPDSILITRLMWTTRLPLAGLQSARRPTDADRHSLTIRTFGNGGFYSITGWYWSKALGAYRCFVTDPKRIVILKFARRTIMLSPDAPEEFIRALPPETRAP